MRSIRKLVGVGHCLSCKLHREQLRSQILVGKHAGKVSSLRHIEFSQKRFVVRKDNGPEGNPISHCCVGIHRLMNSTFVPSRTQSPNTLLDLKSTFCKNSIHPSNELRKPHRI